MSLGEKEYTYMIDVCLTIQLHQSQNDESLTIQLHQSQNDESLTNLASQVSRLESTEKAQKM